jgi:hypothetical protein
MQMTTEQQLAQLAAQQNVQPSVPAQPKPPIQFAFTEIGEQIIASLVKAADEQVAEAEAMRVRVMQLADSIGTQLKEQAAALAEMHERTKAFGRDVLDAHKKFINGGKHENPSP